MTSTPNTANRLSPLGQGAFVRGATTMGSGSRLCLIAFPFEEASHAEPDGDIRGEEDLVQPGEGIVDV